MDTETGTPLKDKKGETITKAFEPIIKETRPEKLQVDQGTEFYYLEDLMDEEIKGGFYEKELQKVSKKVMDNSFKIEEVIRTRGRGKKKEAYVSWVGYPEKFNCYINYDQIESDV